MHGRTLCPTMIGRLRPKPDYVEALTARGYAKLMMKRFEEAETDLRIALEKSPEFVLALKNLALLKLQQQDFCPAAELYDRATQKAPPSADLFNRAGFTAFKCGKPNEALAALDKAVAVDQRSKLALANRGDVHRALGDLEKALADYSAAIVVDPAFRNAIQARSMIYRQNGAHSRGGQRPSDPLFAIEPLKPKD